MSPHASGDSVIVRSVLYAEILLTPILAALAPLGLATLIWLGGMTLAADAATRQALTAKAPPPFYLLLAGLAGWGLLSSAWSVHPEQSLWSGTRLLLLVLIALLHLKAVETLGPEPRRRILRGMAFAGLGYLLIVTLAVGSESPLVKLFHLIDPKNLDDDKSRFNRGIAAYTVLCSAYVMAWIRYRGALWGIAFGFLSVAVLTHGMSMAVPLTILGAGLIGTLAWKLGRPVAFAAYGIMLALFLLLPQIFAALYSQDWVKELLRNTMSWNIKHRLIIWQFATERYFEHPLLGWGLDGSRRLPGGSDSIPGVEGAEFMPLHPHNGFLQVWLELGVPGAILLAISLALLARYQMANLGDAKLRLGLVLAASFAYFIQGSVSYGIWQNWWIAVALLSALHFAITAPFNPSRPTP
ncbi:MAG: O-antigen ligase family protein [Rhodospirillales bacterium]|nr:O-antigen ligase family protein [Rhodospirillales bacterium]